MKLGGIMLKLSSRKRIIFLLFAFFTASIVLMVRLVYLQFVKAEELSRSSAKPAKCQQKYWK